MTKPSWLPLTSRRRIARVYLPVATALVVMTAALQEWRAYLGFALLVPYLVVVALAGRYGGIGPAIFASLATVPLVDFFLFGSPGQFEFAPRQFSQLLLVLVAGLLLGWLLDRLRTERARAEQAAESERTAMAERDALLSVIAHDLRSPLSAVKARAQLAGLSLKRESPDLPAAVRSLEAAVPQIDRISRLLDDLLATGRTDGRTLEVHLAPLDLAPLLARVAQRWREDAPGHTLDLEVATSLPALGDAGRLEQVLDNLIANATKYSPPETTIRLRGWIEAGEVRLSVGDEGPGIPSDEQPRLFERFYRRPEHRIGRQPGIGLGLFITRELVSAHRGRISVDSLVGNGSTFVVALPMRDEESGQSQAS
jgi:signal transduction histidine kinase